MIADDIMLFKVPARCEFLAKKYAENLAKITARTAVPNLSLEVASGFALSLMFAGLEPDDVREVSAEDLRQFIITVMQAAIAHDDAQREKTAEPARASVSPRNTSSDKRGEDTAFNTVYDGLLLPFDKKPKSKKEVN